MASHSYKKNSRLIRAAIWSMFVLALISGTCVLFYIEPKVLESYLINSPRIPQETTAQIHAYNQRGLTVYFSPSQQRNLVWLKVLGGFQLAIAAIALHYLRLGTKQLPEVTGDGT